METHILFRAGLRRHRGSLSGVFLLLFLVSLALGTVLTIWSNSGRYVSSELDRAGFGDLTAWVSQVPDLDALEGEIAALPEVSGVETQALIFSNYEIDGQESDSEGQLITLEPGEGRYRFFTSDLSGYRGDAPDIAPGQVYVSPSLVSMFGAAPGDEIVFPIARAGGNVTFTVAGFYEDPMMGSSMIGMKGFLIAEQTYEEICSVIEETGMDALARDGGMIHIETDDSVTASEINRELIENTPLSMYAEFIHSADTIAGFMAILQNAFCAILAAFAAVLLGVAMAVMGHSISGLVEQEWKNLGILKTLGFTGRQLSGQLLIQYGASVGGGVILGMLLSVPAAGMVSRMTVTTTGVLLPVRFPVLPGMGVLAILLLVPAGFCILCLRKMKKISPMAAIRGKSDTVSVTGTGSFHNGLGAKGLTFHLAMRQVLTGMRRYGGACLVAVFLVFFASLAGRMNGWLGADGKGMMDAFNPADLDLGVQVLGKLPAEEMEQMVLSYTDIMDSYLLAMPNVSVNGTNYTANVITEPERFHISRGKTSREADQVVLTETLAADLGVDVGDPVTIRGNKGSGEFTVSGIYHCANDMGANLGMSREGYLSIGEDDSRMWCCHYFLDDPSQKAAITQALEQMYGGDVHVHENSWPGLSGIISAMHMVILFLYGMSAVFICIVTGMAGSKILDVEKKDMGIFKSIGCSVRMLRLSFAFRFGLAAGAGAVLGTLAAMALTDPIVSAVMRLAGISNFASGNTLESILLPGGMVILLFFGFAWLLSGRIGKEDMSVLTAES